MPGVVQQQQRTACAFMHTHHVTRLSSETKNRPTAAAAAAWGFMFKSCAAAAAVGNSCCNQGCVQRVNDQDDC